MTRSEDGKLHGVLTEEQAQECQALGCRLLEKRQNSDGSSIFRCAPQVQNQRYKRSVGEKPHEDYLSVMPDGCPLI